MLDNQLTQAQLRDRIAQLSEEVEALANDKADLEILLETITEHSTDLENEIYEKNQILLKYSQQAHLIAMAAAAVEEGTFEVASLDEVAARDDELGQLARVFQRMAEQVATRERQLRQQVQELKIEIDRAKQERQVAEIVQTRSFQTLKEKLKKMKADRATFEQSSVDGDRA